jgi:iron complex outermembrane receptor protein
MRDVNANIAGHLQNGFNWNAYGTYRKAGDYENQYDGRVFNSRFNEKNFGGYIGLNKSWGYSHLIVSHVNQYIGMVEGERDSLTGKFLSGAGGTEHIATDAELKSTAMETPYQNIQHLKIVSDNNFAVGKGRIQATVGFQRNQRKEFGNPEAITTPDLYFDLKTVNYTLQYHLPESGGWRTTVGFGGMTQTNRNKAEETLIPEYTLTDYGLFAVTNKTFRKFTLSGGIRGDLRRINSKQGMDEAGDVKFTPFNKSFSNISGSIGAAYDLSDAVTLKANIARGFRAPAMAELSSNGAHEGTLRYELGQQDLKSETSLQGDLGIDVNTSHVSFGVSAFYNHISNYIYYSKLAAADGSDSTRTDDEGNTLTAFKFSQHSANLYGLEATLDIHPHPLDWLHFENSFSYVRGRFVNAIEGDRDIPFIPAGNLRSELRADIRKAGFLRNGYIKVENQLTLQQNKVYTPFGTETITPSYNLLNAGIGTDIVTAGGYKLFSIYLAMNNITDKAYQNHLSRLKYLDANNLTGRNGVFNMGRNFSIRLNVPLNFRLK